MPKKKPTGKPKKTAAASKKKGTKYPARELDKRDLDAVVGGLIQEAARATSTTKQQTLEESRTAADADVQIVVHSGWCW